jgi:hypothetical protein
MIRSLNTIRGAGIRATDGELGRCSDFLFDDRYWVIRYMVVDTRRWLPGRTILVPPAVLKSYAWESDEMVVDLTVEAVKNSPPLETDKPISQQYQERLFSHYQWPIHWAGSESWASAPFTETPVPPGSDTPSDKAPAPEESHLRSGREVAGYRIQATDDGIGHVEDFLVDEEKWTIRYIVVDTRNWLPGRKVLISPLWADIIDYRRAEMHLRMNRNAVENSPLYDPDKMLERGDEEALYAHYAESPYWKHTPFL